jgi:hypothetical protein
LNRGIANFAASEFTNAANHWLILIQAMEPIAGYR